MNISVKNKLLVACLSFSPMLAFAQLGAPDCMQSTVTWGEQGNACSGVLSATKANTVLVANDVEGKGQARFKCDPQSKQFQLLTDDNSNSCKQAYACPSMSITWGGAGRYCSGTAPETPVNKAARVTAEGDGNGFVDVICQVSPDGQNFSFVMANRFCQ